LPTLLPAVSTAAAITAIAATTTTTAATTTIAATASTAATTTARTALLGPGLVDVEIASPHLGPVQPFHGFRSSIVVGHLDEGEAARLAGVTIGYDADSIDCAIGFEQRTNRVFRRVVA